jgi:poly(A) polymerase
LSADPRTGEIFDYFGGLDDLEDRHIRFIGDPLKRIAEDHLRILRFFRFHARFGRGEPDAAALAACTARASDLMTLSRERVADELIKLLGMDDPLATVAIMIERGILKPVLPEIGRDGLSELERLIAGELAAGMKPDAFRRLAALLPREPRTADAVAARLRLSNKARKRLACAAGNDLGSSSGVLAYRLGKECAVDRLLLAGRAADAAAIAGWTAPRLPISGGGLIELGLPEGPIVASTLKQIEERWIEAGFPTGDAFDSLVREVLGT